MGLFCAREVDAIPIFEMADDTNLIQFYSKLDSSKAKVDHTDGMIRGVSVITGNVTAIGHALDIDDTTLNQIELQGNTAGKIPVKINHGSGVDAVCGYLVNFRRKDDQVLADWKLLKNHKMFSQILETAEEQPETVGLSVSFKGPDAPEIVDGRTKARCEILLSTDYVIHPAANPTGLFTAKQVDNQPNHKMPDPIQEPTLADLMTAVQALTTQVTAQGEYIAQQQSNDAEQEALQIAGLTEEQAEAYGIDLADLQAAQEFIAEVHGEEALSNIQQNTQAEIAESGDGAEAGEFTGEAEGAAEGEGLGEAVAAEAGPATATAMSAMASQITELTAIIRGNELAKQKAVVDAEFASTNEKITNLEAQASKVTELEATNAGLVKALAGAGRAPIKTNFTAAGMLPNDDVNAFESRVAVIATELQAANTNLSAKAAGAQAWQQLIAQDPAGYSDFRAKGAVQTL